MLSQHCDISIFFFCQFGILLPPVSFSGERQGGNNEINLWLHIDEQIIHVMDFFFSGQGCKAKEWCGKNALLFDTVERALCAFDLGRKGKCKHSSWQAKGNSRPFSVSSSFFVFWFFCLPYIQCMETCFMPRNYFRHCRKCVQLPNSKSEWSSV